METIVDLSPDDLNSGIFIDESEDEDLIAFNNLKHLLEERGYSNLDDFDYDVLTNLKKRSEHECGGSDYFASYIHALARFFNELITKMANSRATLESSVSTADDVLYLKINSSFNLQNNPAIIKFIDETVQNNIISDSDISVEEIYNIIVTSPRYNDFEHVFDNESLKAFIGEVIPIITNYREIESNNYQRSESHRRKVAEYIMQDDTRKVGDLQKKLDEGRISLIKKIVQVKDEYYAECPKCKKLNKMEHSPVTIIRFDSEKDDKGAAMPVIPNVYECECGEYSMFTSKEYSAMRKLLGKHRTVMNEAVKNFMSFCKGAACIKVEPPISTIIEPIQYLVSNESSTEIFGDKETEEAVGVDVDGYEMLQASKRFYSKIKNLRANAEMHIGSALAKEKSGAECFGSNVDACEMRDEVSARAFYKKIAVYFCKALSLDYTECFNRAMFSLITTLSENPVFKYDLSYFQIIELKNIVKYFETVNESKPSHLNPSKKSIIEYLYKSINAPSGMHQHYTEMSDEEIINNLIRNLDLVRKELERQNDKYKNAIQFIKNNTEYFAYCKILNISGISCTMFSEYVSTKEVFELFSEIADRMIVNNYAGDFYEHWERLGIVNSVTVRKNLKYRSKKVMALRSLCKQFGMFGNYDELRRRFDVVFSSVAEEYSQLVKIVKAMKSNNFYRFCKELCKLDADGEIVDYVDREADYLLSIAIKECLQVGMRETKKSEIEFFLDSQFTKEELSVNQMLFETINFRSFIIRRKDGESPANYVKRFNDVVCGKSKDPYEVISFNEYFEKIKDSARRITIVSLIGCIDYKAYSTSMFMSRLVSLMFDIKNCKNSMYFLGMSDSMRNRYYSEMPEDEIKCEDFEILDDCMRLVLGIYTGKAESFAIMWSKKFNAMILSTSLELTKQIGSSEINIKVQEFLQMVESYDDIVSEEKVDFASDIAEEFLPYVTVDVLKNGLAGMVE